jgi:hypothetical protein
LEFSATAQVPLRIQLDLTQIRRALEAELAKAVRNASSGTMGEMLDATLVSLNFVGYADGATTIELDAYVRTNHFECHVRPRWQLPRSKYVDSRVVNDGSRTDCSHASIIAAPFIPSIESKITEQIVEALDKAKLASDSETLEVWKRYDPKWWSQLVEKAYIAMHYCRGRNGENGLCFDVSFDAPDQIESWKQMLIGRAPSGSGPADGTAAKDSAATYRKLAREKNLKPTSRMPVDPEDKAVDPTLTVGRYPAEFTSESKFVDFDMALFGGLMCAGGERRGCALMRASQDVFGRFWRSPDRVGLSGLGDGAPFSGDAFLGVAAFFASQAEADRFRKYLRYIRGNKAIVYGREVYKSCQGDDAFQCVLAGSEWLLLNLLAKRFGQSAAVPLAVRNPQAVFGFEEHILTWQAMFNPAGYRLHLTAVQVWLIRQLRGDSAELRLAASLLAGRQPNNAFFLYLHLGRDKTVQDVLNKSCIPSHQQIEYTEWMWQAAMPSFDMSDPPWDRSMRWDCAFMYNLMAAP